jgi:hypothetical protein
MESLNVKNTNRVHKPYIIIDEKEEIIATLSHHAKQEYYLKLFLLAPVMETILWDIVGESGIDIDMKGSESVEFSISEKPLIKIVKLLTNLTSTKLNDTWQDKLYEKIKHEQSSGAFIKDDFSKDNKN